MDKPVESISEEMFRLLPLNTPDLVMMQERGGKVIAASGQVEKFIGCKPNDCIGTDYREFIFPEDLDKVSEFYEQTLSGNEMVRQIYRIKNRNGELLWVEHYARRVIKSPEKTWILSHINDISEQKRAEEALRISEEKFSKAFHVNPAAMLITNSTTGKIIDANESYQRILGFSIDELKSENFLEMNIFYVPADLQKVLEQLRANGFVRDFETTLRTKLNDPKQVLFSLEKIEIENAPCLLSIIMDISERRQAEKTIGLRDELLHLTGDIAKVGGWEFQAETMTGTWTDEVAKIHDLDPRLQTNVALGISFYSGKSREQIVNAIKEAVESAKPYDLELEMTSAKGVHKWVRTVGFPVLKNGKVVTVRGIFQDISDRKNVENELRETNEKLIRAQRVAHIGSWENNLATNGLHWSDEMYNILGFPPGKAVNLDEVASVFPKEELDRFQKAVDNAINQNTPYSADYRISRPDGSVRHIHDEGEVVRDEKGQAVIMYGTTQDITQRKIDENTLTTAIAEKEVLIRELYHRTKNNMQVICAMLNLQLNYTQDEKVREVFRDMENRILSMSLVQQKLYQSKNLSNINLRDYVADLAELLMKSYKFSNKKILLHLDELESIPVMIDSAVSCGLILNELISNSLKYAFPGDQTGDITISVQESKNRIIEMCVSDNGIGVPKNFDFRNDSKLGLKIIFSLGESQLQGEVVFASLKGLSCTVRFKDSLYDRRI